MVVHATTLRVPNENQNRSVNILASTISLFLEWHHRNIQFVFAPSTGARYQLHSRSEQSCRSLPNKAPAHVTGYSSRRAIAAQMSRAQQTSAMAEVQRAHSRSRSLPARALSVQDDLRSAYSLSLTRYLRLGLTSFALIPSLYLGQTFLLLVHRHYQHKNS